MRVFTHNFLQSTVKGITTGYPLQIEASNVVVENSPFDKEMILKMIPRLNYQAVVQASKQLLANNNDDDATAALQLPDTLPVNHADDDEFLRALHHALFDIHLVEGFLICPGSGRRFPVKDSIPNMILHEDEI